eukprot:gene6463-8892_t
MLCLDLCLFAVTLINFAAALDSSRARLKTAEIHISEYKYSHFFTQRLDHFDRQNNVTFKQRYFINDTFWNGKSGSPVFMCVGGEGPPLDWTVLVSSVHCNDMVELASSYDALLVALEHRYYGPSKPFDSYATENLKWLNSEQALGDIASFHSLISEKYNLDSSNRWITWGGSYPGMMAALARLRFPHLIFAAVSSSAPLKPSVDMPGYNNVVAESLAATDVGGSQLCVDIVKEGHRVIGDYLQTPSGRRTLETMFNVCVPGSLDDVKNQEQFAGDGVVYIPVQSNDPSCTSQYCDISKICSLMVDKTAGSPLEKLVILAKSSSSSCMSVSYESMINSLSNPSNPGRTWEYQTCSEWGFYQTCEVGSNCPYTQGLHTLDIDYDICQRAFGISAEEVNNQIAYTQSTYGGDNIQGSRILFVNGEIDPWHANSVLTSPNDLEPTIWVKAASHHFWTHPSLPSDSTYVNEARQQIWKQVGLWLQD